MHRDQRWCGGALVALALGVGIGVGTVGAQDDTRQARVRAVLAENRQVIEHWHDVAGLPKAPSREERNSFKLRLAAALGIKLQDEVNPDIYVTVLPGSGIQVSDVAGTDVAGIESDAETGKLRVVVSSQLTDPASRLLEDLDEDQMSRLTRSWRKAFETAAVGPRRILAVRDEINTKGTRETVRGLIKHTAPARVFMFDEPCGPAASKQLTYAVNNLRRLKRDGWTHVVLGLPAASAEGIPALSRAIEREDPVEVQRQHALLVGHSPTGHEYRRVYQEAADVGLKVTPVAMKVPGVDSDRLLARTVSGILGADPRARVIVLADGRSLGRITADRERVDPSAADLLRQEIGGNQVVTMKVLTEAQPHSVVKLMTGWAGRGDQCLTIGALIDVRATDELKTLPVFADGTERLQSWDLLLVLPGWDFGSLPAGLR